MKMRRHFIVSGILLIFPIIDFAVTAPVLVQEKPRAGLDVAHTPEDVIPVFGKRTDEWSELWLDFLRSDLAKPEGSSAARPSSYHQSSSSPPSGPADGSTGVAQSPPSIPEGPPPVSSLGYVPPNPGSLKESEYEPVEWEASPPPSGPALSTAPDHELVGAHALPNLGLSTVSDHAVVDVPPSLGSAPPIESDHKMEDERPSGSLTYIDHLWMDPYAV